MRYLFILSCFIISLELHAKDEALITTRSLNLESARMLAWHAIDECRRRGYSVAVAVVDRGGNVQAFYRDRFAGPHTFQTAINKAWTAVSFRQNTNDLADMLQKGQIPNQVQHNPGALLVGGGVNVYSQGEIVAGVGVSGAPPGKTEKDSIDGACAIAGIRSIEEVLEFAD